MKSGKNDPTLEISEEEINKIKSVAKEMNEFMIKEYNSKEEKISLCYIATLAGMCCLEMSCPDPSNVVTTIGGSHFVTSGGEGLFWDYKYSIYNVCKEIVSQYKVKDINKMDLMKKCFERMLSQNEKKIWDKYDRKNLSQWVINNYFNNVLLKFQEKVKVIRFPTVLYSFMLKYNIEYWCKECPNEEDLFTKAMEVALIMSKKF